MIIVAARVPTRYKQLLSENEKMALNQHTKDQPHHTIHDNTFTTNTTK